jgi:hypothetical protein
MPFFTRLVKLKLEAFFVDADLFSPRSECPVFLQGGMPPYGVIRPTLGFPPLPVHMPPRPVPYGTALGSAPQLYGLPPPAPLHSGSWPQSPVSRSIERVDEPEDSKQAAEAWSAYKAADGTVYYYNQMTGESSWRRPQSFIGDESRTSSNPVPVSSGALGG